MAGNALIVVPVFVLIPWLGNQVEVEAGIEAETERVLEVVLRQMLLLEGLTLNCGKGFTVIEVVELAVQPLAAVTVSEYKPPWLN